MTNYNFPKFTYRKITKDKLFILEINKFINYNNHKDFVNFKSFSIDNKIKFFDKEYQKEIQNKILTVENYTNDTVIVEDIKYNIKPVRIEIIEQYKETLKNKKYQGEIEVKPNYFIKYISDDLNNVLFDCYYNNPYDINSENECYHSNYYSTETYIYIFNTVEELKEVIHELYQLNKNIKSHYNYIKQNNNYNDMTTKDLLDKFRHIKRDRYLLTEYKIMNKVKVLKEILDNRENIPNKKQRKELRKNTRI